MTKRLPTFDAAITFLETQLEALDQRRVKIAAALDGLRYVADATVPLPSLKVLKGGKANGTAAIVLASIRDGKHKLADIAKDAKVKESTARTAVLALESSGKVKREGKGSSTKYVAA